MLIVLHHNADGFAAGSVGASLGFSRFLRQMNCVLVYATIAARVRCNQCGQAGMLRIYFSVGGF